MDTKQCIAAGLFLAKVLMTASDGYAEVNVDVRVKAGNAAGIQKFEQTNFPDIGVSGDGGENLQVEVILSQKLDSGLILIVGEGVFGRTHKGNMNDLVFFPSTNIEYDAWGMSDTAGIGINASENFHFEGRVELDMGRGKPSLSSPGWLWNPVDQGSYAALALIFGGYYTLGKPGLQIGLELGVQSFVGEFQIWNNFYWADARVRGSGGISNLVIGARF